MAAGFENTGFFTCAQSVCSPRLSQSRHCRKSPRNHRKYRRQRLLDYRWCICRPYRSLLDSPFRFVRLQAHPRYRKKIQENYLISHFFSKFFHKNFLFLHVFLKTIVGEIYSPRRFLWHQKLNHQVLQQKPMTVCLRQFSGGKTSRANSGVWNCIMHFGERIIKTRMP